MISKYTYKKLTWIDMEAPTKEEVLSVVEDFKLPDLITTELLTETVRSKVDRYHDCVYLVLHFPAPGRKNMRQVTQEIDFVVGRDFLITAHNEPSSAIHHYAKNFEVQAILERDTMNGHAGFLFFQLIRELYHASADELESLDRELVETERSIFDGKEQKMVAHILELNRQLIDFKRALRFHKEVLQSFAKAGIEFFGAEFSYYLDDIIGEHNKVQSAMENHKEMLAELRQTNDSLLASKTNDTMKTLTTMNFIILPVSLIAWIFSMHTDFYILKDKTDFLIILLIMVLTGIMMFVYFKSKKWL